MQDLNNNFRLITTFLYDLTGESAPEFPTVAVLGVLFHYLPSV
jgi:hypothetical protein